MKVKILEIDQQPSKNFVTFSTEFGVAKALWAGNIPEVYQECFVEFEIPDVLVWGKNIIQSEKLEYSIGMDNDLLYLAGILESVESDGYTVIRLGETIVSIEADGRPFKLGTYVKIKTNRLVLYDIKY